MADHYLRKYGTANTIDFELYAVTCTIPSLKVDAASTANDIKIMKDEGNEANATNLFTDEGQGYSLALTTGECTAARIVVYINDATTTKTWRDKTLIIETYGHASAQHAFDLDTASGGHTVEQTGTYTANDILSIALSVLAGETTSSGATFKTPDGSATRVSATIDASNNRTAMTLDPSS
jgi:hypothetical protein